MANEIDALLARVDDPALRRDLKAQFDRLRQKRQFGLVFEEHLPERVVLPQHPIRRGTKVVPRDDPDADPRVVASVRSGAATLPVESGDPETVPVDSLIAIAEFGEAIYPGLKRLGSVERGRDKPAHVAIKGENHHALEALQFTHAGKVDCIYIDPPYNTGARDWKYNNDYVDGDDSYRHSKWLAMMQRRLLVAKELLNPDRSALIVTIDEKEVHRLGLLLSQIFPGVRTQTISSVINPAGTGRQNEFSRTNEYLFFLQFGDLQIEPMAPEDSSPVPIEWEPFRRRDLSSVRHTRPRQFYPIYVDHDTKTVVGTGEPLSKDQDRNSAPSRPGCATVFPVRQNGTEMNWALTREAFERRLADGYVRVGRHQPDGPQEYVISYLRTGPITDIAEGRAVVTGHNDDGSVIAHYPDGKRRMPLTQWAFASHDAQRYGTLMLRALTPGRHFPFPKSLYAVEDAIRIAVGPLPNAVVLDYFAGSGTTAHAVARLNRQDNGHRISVSITNNEVSESEAKRLSAGGYRPGDEDWEALGVFEQVTRPRITAAITGCTPEGKPAKGDYKFTDEFPLAEGFEENVEFVELTYLDAEDVELDMAFANIAPLLWMRAGSRGPIIEQRTTDGEPLPFASTDVYAILFDPDEWRSFLDVLSDTVSTVFVVTDSASVFAGVAADLPDGLDVVRLYENYLTTFAINQGGRR